MASNELNYKINFKIPQGPTGANGVYSSAFGGLYSSKDVTYDTSDGTGFKDVQLDKPMESQGVTVDIDRFGLIVPEAGVYKISYNVDCLFNTVGTVGSITVTVNNFGALEDVKMVYSVTEKANYRTNFARSALVMLSKGTLVKLKIKGNANFTVNKYSRLIVEKLNQ